LPPAEVETRSSISKAKGKALLAESGKDFELQLLLTQNEALTYGEHLAKTAAKMEANAARVEFLTSLATELSRHQQKVIAVLLANYTLQASK
jgi:hypothetical protein